MILYHRKGARTGSNWKVWGATDTDVLSRDVFRHVGYLCPSAGPQSGIIYALIYSRCSGVDVFLDGRPSVGRGGKAVVKVDVEIRARGRLILSQIVSQTSITRDVNQNASIWIYYDKGLTKMEPSKMVWSLVTILPVFKPLLISRCSRRNTCPKFKRISKTI